MAWRNAFWEMPHGPRRPKKPDFRLDMAYDDAKPSAGAARDRLSIRSKDHIAAHVDTPHDEKTHRRSFTGGIRQSGRLRCKTESLQTTS
jgi:hypothetical protein